jgi:ankyrin repeat protein
LCSRQAAAAPADEVDREDENGRTPLQLACEEGDLDAAKRLVAAGADIHKDDKEGKSPLWFAVESRHLDVARWLIETGADCKSPMLKARDRMG